MFPRAQLQFRSALCCVFVSYAASIARAGAPNRLDLEGTEARFTIFQRSSFPIPGSARSLVLNLSDIQRQTVQVSIIGPDGYLLHPLWMKEGDSTTLELKDESYVLTLERLVNMLFANDYATFSLLPKSIKNRVEIEYLIKRVELSDLTFLRGGIEFRASELAVLMREKWVELGYAVSRQEFIEKLPGKFSEAGDPYLVQLRDGQTKEMDVWLKTPLAPNQARIPAGSPIAPLDHREAATEPCRLGQTEFDSWLDRIRRGDEVFLFVGNPFMSGSEFAGHLSISVRPGFGSECCYDGFVNNYVHFLEQSGDAYQVRQSDGRIVRTSAWLEEQLASVVDNKPQVPK